MAHSQKIAEEQIMRGSIYYQTATLAKIIFREGALKTERVDPNSDKYQCIASYSTMTSYRQIWNNLGLYMREVWSIKNFEIIEDQHIEDYLESKIADGISQQYAEKIASALVKLELALTRFSAKYSNKKQTFSKEKYKVIAEAKKEKILVSNYHNRAYENPHLIIDNIEDEYMKLAAKIQLEGGARFKGIRRIKRSQLQGYLLDDVTQIQKGLIETKEKGGRQDVINVSVEVYQELLSILEEGDQFEIDYLVYVSTIRDICNSQHIQCHGSHGFRWNFAKQRMREFQCVGWDYDTSLKQVSREMKHNRKEITEHYLS